MKKILLIRHGETTWNVERKFQGKTDIPLSEAGKAQAAALATRMRKIDVDCIYSSPLQRAAETAMLFAKEKGLEVTTCEALREVDFGRWEGLTLPQIKQAYPEEYAQCRKDPVTHGFRHGLSYQEVQRQIRGFIHEYVTENPAENIAVVSHNVILKMLILTLLDLPEHMVHSFYLDNCSISAVAFTQERKLLIKLNDNAHIDEGIRYQR